jgi:uncharacterized protein YneR
MKFEVTNPKAWKAVNEKNIPMSHKIKIYEKLGGAYRLGEDGGEQVFNKMTELLKHKMNEGTAKANILGIDFNISETDFRIFFAFKDKKEASIKVRQIGSNKIVNLIQNSLDKAYGKGEFFFRSGTNSEMQNGYLFQKKENTIDLNKLKFELVIKEEDYSETPEETLAGLNQMAMGQLERIGDYAGMIAQRMQQGQNLDSWMYSQITLAVDQLNSVHDAMDGTDGVKEPIK